MQTLSNVFHGIGKTAEFISDYPFPFSRVKNGLLPSVVVSLLLQRKPPDQTIFINTQQSTTSALCSESLTLLTNYNMNIHLLARYLILLTLLLTCFSTFAQTKTVSGKVTDEKGSPIAGATLKIIGSSVATSSGTDGTFTLEHNLDSAVLEVTYIGYLTQEIPVRSEALIISLETSSGQYLDDIVVLCY